MSTTTLTGFRLQDLPAGRGWTWTCGPTHPIAVVTDADLVVDVVGTHTEIVELRQEGELITGRLVPAVVTLDELRERGAHKMRSLIDISLGLEGLHLRYGVAVRVDDGELQAALDRALA